MVSYAAAMLDELMGRNRNTDPNEKPKDLNWADNEVCKYHLCSFCPHELFTNTRADLGLCNKIHDDELARNYRKSSKFMKMGYEEDFLFYLESLVNEVDRRIKRGHARLALNAAHQQQQLQGITEAQEERIKQLSEKINDAIEKAEKLGCEGQVDEAQLLMKQCDQMKEERRLLEDFKQSQPLNLNNSHKEMEVCPICGAFLVVGDAIQRVEEHLQGKQHLGYARVRETIENLKKKLKGEDPEREARLQKEREDREKEKERERSSNDKDVRSSNDKDVRSSNDKDARSSRDHKSSSRSNRSSSRSHRSRSRSHRSRSRDRKEEKSSRDSDRKRKSYDDRRSRSRSRDGKSSRSEGDKRSSRGYDDGDDGRRRRRDDDDTGRDQSSHKRRRSRDRDDRRQSDNGRRP